MAAPGPDGHSQMHLGAPSQIQHQQAQQQMHVQMVGGQVIRHAMPMQGGPVVRMPPTGMRQRPQMAKLGGMLPDQPMPAFANGPTRSPIIIRHSSQRRVIDISYNCSRPVTSSTSKQTVGSASPEGGLNALPDMVAGGGPMPQQVHVISQAMFQQASTQATYMTADGGQPMHTGVVDAQQRPIVTSYGQPGNVHLQTVYQLPNQTRRRAGVQQPMYNTGIRLAQPMATGGCVGGGGNQVRIVTNNNGTSMMQLVDQGSHQVPVSQAHYIQQEVQQPAPQRMVVTQRPMMVIQTPQQVQGQQLRPNMMMQQLQQQQQQKHSQQGIPSDQVTPTFAVITPEQRQQHIRNRVIQYIAILDKAINDVRTQRPDINIKSYHHFRENLERVRDGNGQLQMAHVEEFIRKLQQNSFHLLQKRNPTPAANQQQQQLVGGGTSVMGHKILTQKRNPMVMAPGQRLAATAVRPTMAALASSGLNSLLSQPVDVVSDGFPTPRQHQQHPTQQSRVILTAAQQQQLAQAALIQHQPPADTFSKELDMIMKDFMLLEERYGKERFNRARCEISDETRELRIQSGHLLPRDLFPPASPCQKPDEEVKVQGQGSEGSTVVPLASRKRGVDDPDESPEPSKRIKLDGDADGKDIAGPFNDEVIASDVITKVEPESSHQTAALVSDDSKLFIEDTAVRDADFSEESLNPKLRAEFHRLRSKLYEVTLTPVAHCNDASDDSGVPSMEEMESQLTCQDVAEWKSSLVVKLVFEHKMLPCDVPPLYVRLAPDYLSRGVGHSERLRINWYTRPSEFENPKSSQDGKIHFFTKSEIAEFLKLCSELIGRYVEPLRSVTCDPSVLCTRSLAYVAEVWMKSLLMAMTECMCT